VIFALVAALTPASAYATTSVISVQLADPTPGTTGVVYTYTWSGYQTATAVKCVAVSWSTTASGGTKPTGMAVTGTTLNGTFLNSSALFVADNTSAATGTEVYNYATGITPTTTAKTITISGVTNPTNAAGETDYMTVTTYNTQGSGSSGACGGTVLDAASVSAFETSPGQTVSVNVDPILSLTVAGVTSGLTCGTPTTTVTSTASAVNLGHLNAITQHPIGGQTLTIATNANSGYTVYISGTTMAGAATSHVFTANTGTNGTPIAWPANGTEAWGYTTSSSVLSGTATRFNGPKFAGLTTTNSEIMHGTTVSAPAGDSNCIAYEASIAANSPADAYVSTVKYDAVASF